MTSRAILSAGGAAPQVLLLPDRRDDDAALRRVRSFHLGGDPGELEAPDAGALPALLWAYRDPGQVRTSFPLFLEPGAAASCEGLVDRLRSTLEAVAPGGTARILEDNLIRLEHLIAEALAARDRPVEAGRLIADAGALLRRQLALPAEHDAQLGSDLAALAAALPETGQVLGLGPHTPVVLALHAVQRQLPALRAAFDQQRLLLCDQLQGLLDVDRHKQPAGRGAEAQAAEVGQAARLFDTGALAKALGEHRGAVPLSAERRQRIERALASLQAAAPMPLAVVLHDGGDPASVDWLAPDGGVVLAQEADPCAAAIERFDAQAAEFAVTLRAVRVARLELSGAYQADRHDPWLESLGWEAFGRDELLLLPAVIVVSSAGALASGGLSSLSRLLGSGRPVRVLALVHPAESPGAEADDLGAARLELAYLGVSHREAYVHQSSAARPEHLCAGLLGGAAATRAALHVISVGTTCEGQGPAVGAWLHSGAALEGRAHPFFRYDPQGGSRWASRMDFAGNPQPELDWPLQSLPCRSAEGEATSLDLAFTFADFALLEPGLRAHYRAVPDACAAHGDLVPLADWLALPADEAAGRIPCVWAAEPSGRLRRLVISRRLAWACRDRLGFWHTLQELAGINNQHVEAAVAVVRAEAQASIAEARAQLEAEHAEALARAEREVAGEAMTRLAAALTDLDGAVSFSASPSRAAAPAPLEVVAEAAEVEVSEAQPEPEEESLSFDEPWIDSAMCTSCNDCINLNTLLFTYDANKQARIGDVSKGTFAQLVKAAELCPARCIHPGKPQDPGEPNLAELIERAGPFN